MAQQTAMMQLIEWISSDCSPMDCVMKAKELLEVERENIENAYMEGSEKQSLYPSKSAVQYYNETYKQSKNHD